MATDWNNLGAAWWNKGDYDKAIDYYEKALKVMKRFLGTQHPSTIIIINNLKKARQKLADSQTP